MKETILKILVFTGLALSLWFGGDRIVQAGRNLAPESWTTPGPTTRTVAIRSYGVDQMMRQSLFGPPVRRNLFLVVLGLYALSGLAIIWLLTRLTSPESMSGPEWSWWDLLWVTLGVIVFWSAMPSAEGFRTADLLLKDLAIGAWIWTLGLSRGLGARAMGLEPLRAPADFLRGMFAAMMLLPALALVVLMASVKAGVSAVPTELTLPVPATAAALWLSVLILPFFEEILFRSFLYRLVRHHSPEILANLGVSLLFAALHDTSGAVGVGRFLGSLLMCRLYERTGTVWSSLGAHATFNAILLLAPAVF